MFFSDAAMKYPFSRFEIRAAIFGANHFLSLMDAISDLPITLILLVSTYCVSSVFPLRIVRVPVLSAPGSVEYWRVGLRPASAPGACPGAALEPEGRSLISSITDGSGFSTGELEYPGVASWPGRSSRQ